MLSLEKGDRQLKDEQKNNLEQYQNSGLGPKINRHINLTLCIA